MGKIFCKDGGLVTTGVGPYMLPDTITCDFISVLLSYAPHDDLFVGAVAREFTKVDKERLRVAAKNLGGNVWRKYCSNALKWAPLLNPDNKWHLEDFNIVFKAQIGSSWAREVIITDKDVRLVRTARGLFSFPEFAWQYDVNIIEHMSDHQSAINERMIDAKIHIQSDLVKRSLTVSDSEGKILTKVFIGLDSLPAKRWRLTSGCTFLSEDLG